MRNRTTLALLAGLICLAVLAAAAKAMHASSWGQAQKIDEIAGNSPELNTTYQDGCPIQSPDGRSLYLASNRPRFAGDTRTDLDIWVAHRTSKNAPWGAPVNLGEPVNSTADDFCPTPIRGKGLFFVSRKTTTESCGLGDIYLTRQQRGGWREPTHLACAPEGPNSALDEQGPSYVKAKRHALLYFSSSSGSVPGEIYVSERERGSFGRATPVAELNSTGNDIQPNVRKDGREVVFSSNRPGTLGGQDIWVSTRRHLHDAWSEPVNLGDAVNTAVSESRPSLSRDALTLLFGRAPGPEGSGDIFVSTRAVKHAKH